MKAIIATFVAALALAPVAALAAAPSSDATKSAQSDCSALQAKLGATAFTQAYGTFGGCVSKFAPVEQQSITSANATCQAQQADTNFAASHNGKTFDQFYGTGKKGSNSFGNCVSSLAKASQHTEQQARLNPARTCRAQQTAMGGTVFTATYRNFGACVSKVARAQNANEVSAADSCKTQQSQDEAGFDQKFANFGACVSQAANATSTQQSQSTVNAAKQCYAQRKADATAFKTKYHTFGACVSQMAHA
jgi:hypothetical protein